MSRATRAAVFLETRRYWKRTTLFPSDGSNEQLRKPKTNAFRGGIDGHRVRHSWPSLGSQADTVFLPCYDCGICQGICPRAREGQGSILSSEINPARPCAIFQGVLPRFIEGSARSERKIDPSVGVREIGTKMPKRCRCLNCASSGAIDLRNDALRCRRSLAVAIMTC
jgi:hypothetical protein